MHGNVFLTCDFGLKEKTSILNVSAVEPRELKTVLRMSMDRLSAFACQ